MYEDLPSPSVVDESGRRSGHSSVHESFDIVSPNRLINDSDRGVFSAGLNDGRRASEQEKSILREAGDGSHVDTSQSSVSVVEEISESCSSDAHTSIYESSDHGRSPTVDSLKGLDPVDDASASHPR